MQVKVEKQYPIATGVEQAWKILSDVPELAACMPGADLSEKVDDQHYKGNIKIKVGPVTAAFGGEIEILDLLVADKTIRLRGKGSDKGGSSASMDLTALLQAGEKPGECVLVGSADVIVNGKFAQFGGRMLNSVTDMVLDQFAQNFSAKAAALQPAASAGADTSRAAAPQMNTQLNALTIAWQLLKDFFANLFGRRKSGAAD
ncbi:MAG: SRPBCC family protein [Betaproteobacteria bacterium]|nr:SRPBCC family protein [Betaproteobacteria bacterium]